MKIKVLILILISFNSYAEWTKFSESTSGDSHYINSEMINRFKDSVAFRTMSNYLKPSEYGSRSSMTKRRADCSTYKYKDEAFFVYRHKMGKGHTQEYKPRAEWYDAPNNSIIRLAITYACNIDKKDANEDFVFYSNKIVTHNLERLMIMSNLEDLVTAVQATVVQATVVQAPFLPPPFLPAQAEPEPDEDEGPSSDSDSGEG
jgi:hypothetical protein